MATFDMTDEERNIALQALWNFKLAHGQLSAGASEQSPEEHAVIAQCLGVIDGVAAKLCGKPNVPSFGIK
jgi:hypothetical protein